jgi:hypothetical protein
MGESAKLLKLLKLMCIQGEKREIHKAGDSSDYANSKSHQKLPES